MRHRWKRESCDQDEEGVRTPGGQVEKDRKA